MISIPLDSEFGPNCSILVHNILFVTNRLPKIFKFYFMTMQTVPKNRVWPTQIKVRERERRSPPSESLGMLVIIIGKNPLSCADMSLTVCSRAHSSVSNDGRCSLICRGLMVQPRIKPKRYRCSITSPVWNCSLHLFQNRTKFHISLLLEHLSTNFYLLHSLKLVSKCSKTFAQTQASSLTS